MTSKLMKLKQINRMKEMVKKNPSRTNQCSLFWTIGWVLESICGRDSCLLCWQKFDMLQSQFSILFKTLWQYHHKFECKCHTILSGVCLKWTKSRNWWKRLRAQNSPNSSNSIRNPPGNNMGFWWWLLDYLKNIGSSTTWIINSRFESFISTIKNMNN